jgi:hypothetical protein
MMLQIYWRTKRVRAHKQCRTTNREERVSHQICCVQTGPSPTAIADPHLDPLSREVDKPSTGIDLQFICWILCSKPLHTRQQPFIRESRGHGNANGDARLVGRSADDARRRRRRLLRRLVAPSVP